MKKIYIKRKILKIIHFIGDFIIALFIASFAYIFITVYRGNVPRVMNYYILRVVSSSMEPEFSEGDCIIAKKVDTDEIKVGDIITFYSDDPMIYNYLNTHRVIDIETNEEGLREYWTKGDGNIQQDLFSAKENKILGVYQSGLIIGKIITKGFDLLSNRIVYFVIIVFPILLSFVSSVVSMVRLIIDDEYGVGDSKMIMNEDGEKKEIDLKDL